MLRLWNLLCSLKLAIALASLATLTIMLGSLWMPGNTQLFGQLETLPLGAWLAGPGREQLTMGWWVYLACALITGFGLNTLCCFIDWLVHLKTRWRKSGEYLLHFGFFLVLLAYIWGSSSGTRSLDLAVPLGATRPLPGLAGHYLHLNSFTPQIDPSGRPLDFPQQLSLRRGDHELTRQQVRFNHPLIWKDIVVIPSSFSQQVNGFRFSSPQGQFAWLAGTRLPLGAGQELEVLDFYPHVERQSNGRIAPRGTQLVNPAFLVQLTQKNRATWKGWYLLREGLPTQLLDAGLQLRPEAPLSIPVSRLTVSIDPGAPLAALGGVLMAIGASIAMISYYAKRRRGERPEVS